ncbi:MAG: acyltransferase family protein, partial [Dehalococcoidia bacterium]
MTVSRWLAVGAAATALTGVAAAVIFARGTHAPDSPADSKISTRPASAVEPGSNHRAPRLPYFAGVDGLRALAVIAVVLYHTGLGWMPGGFLGVEVFFVISGYLITSILLRERERSGKMDLRRFWMRRARRLLPAVFVLILSVLVYAVVFLPEEVAKLRSESLAAIGYVSNWYQIFRDQSYFESLGRPSLFLHLWSLAVEEQFYLLWPALFALVFAKIRARHAVVALVAIAAASTVLMAIQYQPGVDSSRIYYGTDTRAAGLLIGAALALVWAPGRLPASVISASHRTADTYGLLALGGLIAFSALITESDRLLYQGGFAIVALLTALVIAAAVHPGARTLQSILGWRPLVWIGLRSYSIYLWHWPVFMVTRPHEDVALDGVLLLALRLALTLTLAELSYRLVER